MAELTVAILGLGRLGASLGLALKRYNEGPNAQNHFTIVGYDTLPSQRQEAQKLGAVDKINKVPHLAVEDCDVVVVATPYAEVQRIFREMAGGLRDGAVVMDLSPLKQPSMRWSAKLFPSTVYLVGATAVVNPIYLWDGLDDTAHARADLFDDGDFLLAPAPSAAPDAAALVTQMSELVGAGTHFVDPAELDGLAAATEGIPAVLGVVAMRAMSTNKGWQEVQRVTNPNFGRLTHHLLDTHPDDLRDVLLHNRENIVHQLDRVIGVLNQMRDVLDEGDEDAIEATLTDAEERYRAWLGRRTSGKWDPTLNEETNNSAMGSMLSGMLGGFLADRLQGKDKDDKK